MLGDSALLGGGGGAGGGGSSADAAAVLAATAASAAGGNPRDGAETAEAAAAGGGVGSNSGGEEDSRKGEEAGDRSFGGNRWPRQETLALLKIRSDMDVAFRDASVKGPLWEEVSRKLAELGYHRSAKKCKEKFENVYKYHKRTKEGRTGKSDGKTYRFFDQLAAFDQNHPPIQSSSAPSRHQRALSPTPVSVALAPPPSSTAAMPPPVVTVPSTTALPMPMPQAIVTPPLNLTNPSYPSTNPTNFPPLIPNPTSDPPQTTIPPSYPSIPPDFLSNSSSSSTSSDETLEGRRKRKRKWKDFFERLMKELIEKQEDLQKRFLEAIEKREHDRMVREEAWRMQEMARINREREILAQERSMAAAKDAALMAFLQKIAEQQNLGQALNNINIPIPQPQPQSQPPQPQLQPAPTQPTIPAPVLVSVQQPAATAPPQAQPQPAPPVTVLPSVVPPQQQVATSMEITKTDHNGENNNFMASSSSRWPKVEVQALIKLRTEMDAKYQESGPKGPLWEEISAAMRKLGYNRNAKRCKEKWENINKYFKKVKESNKKRLEDSKTCPYFHQLDAIYREKKKQERPESMMTTPLMVRPEQQWPPQQEARPTGPDVRMEDADNEARGRNHEEEDDYDDEDKYGDEEDEDDEGGGNYEIVASKPAPSVSAA